MIGILSPWVGFRPTIINSLATEGSCKKGPSALLTVVLECQYHMNMQLKIGFDGHKPHLIASTVKLNANLEISGYEAPVYKKVNERPVMREFTVVVTTNQHYHALIDEEEGVARLFVPVGGIFEDVEISTEYIRCRDDFDGNLVDYKSWGPHKERTWNYKKVR